MSENKSYRPSNGTEGSAFYSKFCENCKHEDPPDKCCSILARTMAFGVEDEEYPEEWIYNDEGLATCTAFERPGPRRKPKYRSKDPNQKSVFDDE